jgi:hypothetical protein
MLECEILNKGAVAIGGGGCRWGSGTFCCWSERPLIKSLIWQVGAGDSLLL